MCEFISWLEYNGTILFLTTPDLTSSKGRELKKHLGSEYINDVKGHGAIEWYYDMTGKGKHKECTDLSTPDNFPSEIVEAIKSGKFRGIGISKQLLSKPARAEYEKIQQSAWAEYYKISQSARAEYDKKINNVFWDLFADPKNRSKAWR